MQELLLGVGGVRALRALGYNPSVWHMNEGHAAFLTLERARELVAGGDTFEEAMEKTRAQNVFTTHTPVAAGNDNSYCG
jgi:starch phosphorylase